ncbi:MAG TPA: DNA gyrase inhibitor YacG [Sphingobium sp.]|nr:DNA gyrase inhibitor YacG [Sphingobium sp.]
MSINARCPICKKPTVHEFRPFCSRGCRDRDLIQWMDEGYRLPVRPDENEDGTPTPRPPEGETED